MSWTDERTELAIHLYQEGWSAAQIAQKLGGVTRNAVIGKIHRLGYSRKNSGDPSVRKVTGLHGKPRSAKPEKPVATKPTRRRRKSKPITITIPKRELKARSMRDEGPVTFAELGASSCRFAITDQGPDHQFCGAKAMEASSYCEQHHALCHEKASVTKKRAGGRFVFNPHRRAA
jgi:GcrA cell cycle regulator